MSSVAILMSPAELQAFVDERIAAALGATSAPPSAIPSPDVDVLRGYVRKSRLTAEQIEDDAAWEKDERLRSRQLEQVITMLTAWLDWANHPRDGAIRQRLGELDFHGAGDFYFFKSTPGDLIKIGTSTNVPSRLAYLCSQGGLARLDCLAYGPGGVRVERFLHFAFREFREDGEWFRPSPIMANLIERCSATNWIWS